jgi:uncharacterized membrane protein YqgA involved in biofilm formation
MLLAQLVDLIPSWAWDFLLFGGMAAPVIGPILKLVIHRVFPKRTHVILTAIFYATSLPICVLVLNGTENPKIVCSFLLLMPVGLIIGFFAILSPKHPKIYQGFPVIMDTPKNQDKSN